MRWLTAAMAAPLLAAATVAGAAGGAHSAVAQPSATPEAGAQDPVAGEEVCTVADPRLAELSGLVAVDDGYVVVNDSTEFADRLPIFFLDQSCAVVDQQGFDPGRPRDPEDMALDREANVLWVSDTGDNFEIAGGEPRATVALWRVELEGDRTPVIYRFTYPDGPYDAEALLLDGDGTPIIVTKEIGNSQLFRPAEELQPSASPEDAQALELVGEFTPQDTGTEHPLGPPATQVVTGGANAPDNSTVVLRTYTDAYEFDVAEGDVATAIADGEPRVTPLPEEPLGEAISYSADGERFVTVSEVPPDVEYTPVVLSYAPAAPAAPPEEPEGGGAAPPAEGGGGGSLFDSVQDIINLIAIVGVVGVLLVGAGIFGIVRARRRAAGGGKGGAGGTPPAGPVTGRARLVGEPPDQPGGQPTGVYSSQTARQQPGQEYGGEYRGTEYGGATEYRGTQYGGGGEYGYGADPYQGAPGGQPGYHDQPYDQEQDQGWSNGHRGQPQQGYQAQADPGYGGHNYADPGYGYQGPPPGYQQVAPPPPAGGTYQSGGYGGPPDGGYQGQGHEGHPGQDGYQGADGYRGEEYSDDPDYPYEFRQRPGGRWQER